MFAISSQNFDEMCSYCYISNLRDTLHSLYSTNCSRNCNLKNEEKKHNSLALQSSHIEK